MSRGQNTPYFDIPPARHDTPAHHIVAIGCTCAVVCVLIFGMMLSIVVAASRGEPKPRCLIEATQ